MASQHPARKPAPPEKPTPTRVVPDREFLRRITGNDGLRLRQCVQCATCSGVCGLTAEEHPFPRKEMLWAQWGLAERILTDVDLWLCHECQDCTLRCPRDARPGDVMAALRRECVTHYSVPGSIGRAASQPANLPWFLLGSVILLTVGILGWDASGVGAKELASVGPRIVMPFWPRLPHGLIMTLFGAVVAFDCIALGVGLWRFWKALLSSGQAAAAAPPMGWIKCLRATSRRIAWHEDFATCKNEASRQVSHTLVIYGMVGLIAVDLWVIIARYNPLRIGLVYPLGPFDPWKLLANGAGALLVLGCLLMSLARLRRDAVPVGGSDRALAAESGTSSAAGYALSASRPSGTYSDWLLLLLLLTAAVTGFATEGLHFLRLDTARFAAYSVHLVSVLTLLLLLPYSKLAHLGYRTLAIVFVERYGIRRRLLPAPPHTDEAR
jgi:quinone-modifying oxidoreductase, subunit QmoC